MLNAGCFGTKFQITGTKCQKCESAFKKLCLYAVVVQTDEVTQKQIKTPPFEGSRITKAVYVFL